MFGNTHTSRQPTPTHCNIPDNELSETELKLIEQRMHSSEFSSERFLKGQERLANVIQTDSDYLKSVSITHQQISDTMGNIVGQCKQFYRDNWLVLYDPPLMVDKTYIVSMVSYMGAQECPYKNDAVDPTYHGEKYGDSDVTISNVVTKETITFNTLLIHLIGQHHFFESPSCKHRLDPAAVIKYFDLKPGSEPVKTHTVSILGDILPTEYIRMKRLEDFARHNLIYRSTFTLSK